MLSDTFSGQDIESPDVSRLHNNNLPPQNRPLPAEKPTESSCLCASAQAQVLGIGLQVSAAVGPAKHHLSVEHSLSAENPPLTKGLEGSVALKPPRVYTISREGAMTLGGRGSEESLELEVMRSSTREQTLSQSNTNDHVQPSCTSQPSSSAARVSHHRSSHHRSSSSSHHHSHQHSAGTMSTSQPLQSSGSTNSVREWGVRRGGSREDYIPDCVACIRVPCQSQRSLDLELSARSGEKPKKKLERMSSEERALTDHGVTFIFYKKRVVIFYH